MKSALSSVSQSPVVKVQAISLLTLQVETGLTQKMTQKVNVSEKTIKRELAILQGKGFLIREGGRKKGKWVIKIEK